MNPATTSDVLHASGLMQWIVSTTFTAAIMIEYLAILLMNLGTYVYTYIEWKRDRTVPLRERIVPRFIVVTFPTLIGIVAYNIMKE